MFSSLLFQMALIALTHMDIPKNELTVSIAHISDTQHIIYIAVCRKNSTFPSEPDAITYVALDPAGRSSASISIPGIPYGKYALVIFQDMNGTKKLTTGFLGIPSDPIAFSNNVRPLFGPPRWKDCEFEYSTSSYTVNISKLLRL